MNENSIRVNECAVDKNDHGRMEALALILSINQSFNTLTTQS